MAKENKTTAAVEPQQQIENLIFTVRGVQVMLDIHLSQLYQVENRQLKQSVRRNIDRFPDDFMLCLTKEEANNLISIGVSQFVIPPGYNIGASDMFAFTEQGIAMLASILRSPLAIQISLRIIRTFVSMRKFISANAGIFQRIDHIERNQILTDQRVEETNARIDQILDCLDGGSLKQKLGIFFDGQMFDAYVLVETLFKRATRRIILIDDYINADILQRMRVRASTSVSIDCYVRKRCQTNDLQIAFSNYNAQYPDEHCQLHSFERSHDRFLIIDDEVYHFGASIKDLGKRWFSVNLITEQTADELIARLDNEM